MRICYLANAGSVHTQKWVRYFADNGHEVSLISFRPFADKEIGNINLQLLKQLRPPVRVPFLNSLLHVIKIRRLIRELKPDLLHAHFVSGYGWLGSLSGFHPFVVTAWGSDILILPKKSRIQRQMVKYTLRKADLITCDAEHITQPLIELGAEPQKINLINFGVDTQKFKPGQGNGKIRGELGIADSPVVISLRSLEPVYDIESLIASIPLVLKEVPEAKFVIAGNGSRKTQLEELAESQGVSASIRFIGFIPNDELPLYLTAADIYVSTSLSDAGLAGSTAEAMACGLPVIITDFGDNSKWVQDGKDGYIIPLRSPEVLASKIVYLMRNKNVREQFGQRARQVIEDRNSYHKEMGKMGKLYGELIARYNR